MSIIDVSPIRILRVATRLNIGGPARHVTLLTARLNEGLFESRLAVGETDDHEGNMSFLTSDHRISVVRIPALRNGAGPLGDFCSLWALYRLFRTVEPQIVHLHLLKARFLGAIAARLAGVPLVIETFHGHLFNEYYGKVKTTAILAAERFLGRVLMDRVIAISESQRQELVRYGICPEDKIQVIPLGLDLGPFVSCSRFRGQLRSELGISERTLLLGTVGRLVPIKGLGYLVEAIGQMAQKTQRDFVYLFVGDGPLRVELESKVRDLGLSGRVQFLGWRFDLERVYADLDVLVLSSLNEGTPVAVIEAMAASKAVVATRVGGVSDLVHDGLSGLLVPSKDPTALAAAGLRLIENQALRLAVGTRARECVYPRYDISRLVSDMKAFYAGLVGRAQ